MQATVARAAVVGLTILGLSGCQSGGGGWSWPQWGSNRSSPSYPSTADAPAAAPGSYSNQTAAPNVQLPTASATPYNATPYSTAAQGAAASRGAPPYQQPGRQPPAYGGYPEAPTSYAGGAASGGYPSTSAGGAAGQATPGYSEATGGLANPAASAYPSGTSGGAAAVAPQNGYYGAAGTAGGAAASQPPAYGSYYGNSPSTATAAAAAAAVYPSTSSSPSPYAASAPVAAPYTPPESNAPMAPADYANGAGLRTADNRAATGSRYDGGVSTRNPPASGGSAAYPSDPYASAAPAGAAAAPEDRYSKYGTSAPAANDASLNPSRYPAQSPPSGGTGAGGTTSEPRFRPGGTKDYLPPVSSSQGNSLPSNYGAASSGVRPANYESTPAADRYGGMPGAVAPPEVSVPGVTR